MTNFGQRAITGFILVVVTIACISLGSWSFLLLCLVINGFALFEFYELAGRMGIRIRKREGIVLSVTLLTSTFLVISDTVSDWKIMLISLPFAAAIFIIELYSRAENPFPRLAFTFLGITWITLPLLFFISAAFLPLWNGTFQRNLLLGYFFLLWSNDTGAYLVGTLIGKHKLFPSISPKKTWEGSAGGSVLSLIVAYGISFYFTGFSTFFWVGMAVIIVVFGTYGDLLKSVLKRSLNVKDSGTLLPGHGGFIDRFDSLMGSAPFVFAYLALL